MSKLYRPARPISVQIEGDMARLCWRGTSYHGRLIAHWRTCTGWWEEMALRDLYLFHCPWLTAEIYRDGRTGRWYMHRLFD